MTERNQTYRCNVCGNIVSVLQAGKGELVCCGKPMELLDLKSQDEGLEKHVPVIEKTQNGVIVKVGDVPHPMEDVHYIEWIEIHTKNNQVYRAFLEPGMPPQATFPVDYDDIVIAKEYCTLHGLWKSN